MKLLTLNTHSLQEEQYQKKLEEFVVGILQEKPDIIALQEVNQSMDGPLAGEELRIGQFPLSCGRPIRKDNYAAQVAYALRQACIDCSWAWLPIKLGYGKYEEGVAILSLGRTISHVDVCFISKTRDHHNWRTRAVLGVQTEGKTDWFYTVHMGWWEDEEEPFSDQWERLHEHLAEKFTKEKIWLMGDFNAPDTVSGQSYACILASGWMDTYQMAQEKDSGITVSGIIDGWREKQKEQSAAGMRLDYIFCNQREQIDTSCVIFNGRNRPVVSDHFGVLIHVKEK